MMMIPVDVFIALAVVGLAIGSFLGTLAIRLPQHRSLVFARSQCDMCGTVLSPWQLVPIVSWVYQRGTCAKCGARISTFYPLIEIGSASVAVWAATTTAGLTLLCSLLLGWTLLCLAAMDFLSFRLSDVLTVPLLIAGLITSWLIDPDQLAGHLIGAVVGWVCFVGIGAVYRRFRRRDGLGQGDAKLFAAAGAWLGWQALPSVALLSSAIALLVILLGGQLGHKFTAQSKVAFGAYLCAGIWIVWLYGPLYW
jgi:leader peptidase (prepilin peptidase)/N-methyltransferase